MKCAKLLKTHKNLALYGIPVLIENRGKLFAPSALPTKVCNRLWQHLPNNTIAHTSTTPSCFFLNRYVNRKVWPRLSTTSLASFSGARKIGGSAWYTLFAHVWLPRFFWGTWKLMQNLLHYTNWFVSRFLRCERCLQLTTKQ